MLDEIQKDINLLKDLVKESHIKGQMHLDMSLAPAKRIEEYQKAIARMRERVISGDISEGEMKEALGLV